MTLTKVLGKWSPEFLGSFGVAFFGFWAYSNGMPLVITILVAALSGVSLWIATRMATKMAKEGKTGRVSSIATIAGVALPLLTGFLIKAQGLGHEVTVWGTIFFWCGITVGLALGSYGTYHQMR